MAKKKKSPNPSDPNTLRDLPESELDGLLHSRHAEINSYSDLTAQRATNIPALFNIFYKFIQNPSSVSVETFKRMVDTDDTVGSGVDFLTTCLAARMGNYVHPNKTITEWVNKRLEEIDGGFFELKRTAMSASWAGFFTGEVVWANTENGFVPKKVVHLPPSTILFETERTGEITEDGILQYQRNYNPALAQGGVNNLFGFQSFTSGYDISYRPDPLAKLGDYPFPLRSANIFSYLAIRIPKVKCLHYAFAAQGNFQNPYGRSLLRRIYKYYVMKDAFLQMLAVALDRKGTPLTVVFCDPNLTLQDPSKTNMGKAGAAAGRRNVGVRADIAAREAFKNVHNDTTIFLPGRKGQNFDMDFVTQQSNAGDFIEAIKMCNQAMMRGLLIPSLVFMGGDGTGSYALGTEHAKTFDKILDGMNSGLKQELLQQLIRPMIAYNFPRETWEKDGLGDFSKRELTPDEVQKELEALEKGVNMGAIDTNDLNDLNLIRDKLNLEPREKPIENPLMDAMGMGGEPDGDEGGLDFENEQESSPFGKAQPAKGKRPPGQVKQTPAGNQASGKNLRRLGASIVHEFKYKGSEIWVAVKDYDEGEPNPNLDITVNYPDGRQIDAYWQNPPKGKISDGQIIEFLRSKGIRLMAARLGSEPSNEVCTVAVMHDGKILIGKRRDNGKWTFPGGHKDPGESIHEGAIRELMEETGIEVKPDQLKYLGSDPVVTESGKNYVIHCFQLELDEKASTSMKEDPDQEVERWGFKDPSQGLGDLHSKNNRLLQRMGLQEIPEEL